VTRAVGPRVTATRVLSVLLVLVGIALVVRTVAAGGGPAARGILLGVLFVVAGAGRLWVSTRSGGA
jgi:drug/metabolite transporter (DMT)-like permease